MQKPPAHEKLQSSLESPLDTHCGVVLREWVVREDLGNQAEVRGDGAWS